MLQIIYNDFEYNIASYISRDYTYYWCLSIYISAVKTQENQKKFHEIAYNGF